MRTETETSDVVQAKESQRMLVVTRSWERSMGWILLQGIWREAPTTGFWTSGIQKVGEHTFLLF